MKTEQNTIAAKLAEQAAIVQQAAAADAEAKEKRNHDTLLALAGRGIDARAALAGRVESLAMAIDLGADDATLQTILAAVRVKRGRDTILLPAGRYAHCSRGRDWCRSGSGSSVEWGEREGNGHRVGAGRWTVGSDDGFHRKDRTQWTVSNISVGSQTWTIAN